MTDINLKTLTPDPTLPTTGFLFGADSQASTNPSVYSTQTVATTLLGSTSLTGDVLTASAPVLNVAQTWNSGATTFTGIKLAVTDTTSAVGSLLLDFQKSGTSFFTVSKFGAITAGQTGAGNAITANAPTLNIRQRMNSGATAFTLAQFNFEDQASSNSSKYIDIQYTGTSYAGFYKTQSNGNLVFAIGPSGTSGTDPAMIITRGVSTSTTGNGHGIQDLSSVSRTGTIAYASYDAAITYNGTNNFDHFCAYQSRPIYQNAGTTTYHYGLFDRPTVSPGATLTNRYGAYIAESANTGTLTNNYGVYVETLTTGAALNYAVYTAGATPSYFGGAVTFASTAKLNGYTVATLPTAGTAGRMAYVTDALAPSYNAVLVGGGAVVIPVFDNGTAWVAH